MYNNYNFYQNQRFYSRRLEEHHKREQERKIKIFLWKTCSILAIFFIGLALFI